MDFSPQDTEREVSHYLSRRLSGRLAGIDMVDKEDLDLVCMCVCVCVCVCVCGYITGAIPIVPPE